jgi:hypothetical protein
MAKSLDRERQGFNVSAINGSLGLDDSLLSSERTTSVLYIFWAQLMLEGCSDTDEARWARVAADIVTVLYLHWWKEGLRGVLIKAGSTSSCLVYHLS